MKDGTPLEVYKNQAVGTMIVMGAKIWDVIAYMPITLAHYHWCYSLFLNISFGDIHFEPYTDHSLTLIGMHDL